MAVNTPATLAVHSVRNAIVVITNFTYKHYRVGVVCADDNTNEVLHFMINNSVISAYGKEYVFDELVSYFKNYRHRLPKLCVWEDESNFIISEYQQ